MTLRIIGGIFKGRQIKTPKTSSTRPTQGILREAIFNICQNAIGEAKFLDLFAGSGAMGLEALSRGAQHATFVEENRQAIVCIQENIQTLQLEEKTSLMKTSVFRAIQQFTKENKTFDLIYIDPPYHLPFDLNSVADLLAPHGILFMEEQYDPKKRKEEEKEDQDKQKNQDVEIEKLHLVKTRKFGTAIVSIFSKKT